MTTKKDADSELRVLHQVISEMASAITTLERSLRDAELTADALEDIIDNLEDE